MAHLLSMSGRGQTAMRAKPIFSWLAIPRLYSGRIVRHIVFQLLMILLLIEVIFLTEKLNHILRVAIDHKVKAWDVFFLVFYTAPQISDLALPMALMIAVYRVALACREDRELLVLSGMGIGTHQFIWLGVFVGIGVQAASLLVSGLIEPRAQYAHRSVLFNAQHEALRGGVTPGQFYFLENYTVFASPQQTATQERRLFVHHSGTEVERVIVAARARLSEPDAEGQLTLHLYDVLAQDFRTPRSSASQTREGAQGAECPDCDTGGVSEPLGSVRLRKFSQEMALERLLRFDPRGAWPSEWTTTQLLGLTERPSEFTAAHATEAGRRLARSLLCLIAPLIAAIALALTTRMTQAFALPAACAVVMCVDLGLSNLSSLLSPFGLGGTLASLVVGAILAGTLLMQAVLFLQRLIVKPALSRA